MRPARRSILEGRFVIVVVLLGAASAHGAVGDLDASFGAGGRVLTQLGAGSSPYSNARAVVQQPDGRLLVGGSASDALGLPAIALSRHLPDGAFDTSFGPGGSGVVTTQLGAGTMRSVTLVGTHSVALAPDGAIIVCGQASDPSGHGEIVVARYTAAGELDPAFASGGKFALQLAIRLPSGISGLLGCTVQPDGAVVAAGFRDGMNIGLSFAIDAVVLRLDAHGTLDPGFANGGLFIQQLSLGSTQRCDATDALVLPDGRILLSIEGSDASDNSVLGVARLTPSGSLDPDFGANGYTLTTIGSYASGLGRQADGGIVVVGGGMDAMGHQAMLVARFTANGVPDPSFGDGGRRLVQASAAATPRSGAFGLALQPSGKIILIGDITGILDDTQLAITRLASDGSLDPSFGGTGIVLHQFVGNAGAMTLGRAGVFSSDGKLVVAGQANDGSTARSLVASFIADLPPTATFTITPGAPVVGDVVTFDAAASSDADGGVAAVAWDLNGDGIHDDASGATATASFVTGGDHVVGVAVTDVDGIAATATQVVTIGCGTAATFVSVDCRLAALLASVEGGVPAGGAHDRLSTSLTSARTHLADAAAASGKAARRALARARRAVGGFIAAARAGRKDIERTLRQQLLASAKSVRSAMKKLTVSR